MATGFEGGIDGHQLRPHSRNRPVGHCCWPQFGAYEEPILEVDSKFSERAVNGVDADLQFFRRALNAASVVHCHEHSQQVQIDTVNRPAHG
jgi:hypothetical protein